MMPMADQEFEESIFSTSGMRSPASDFLESAPPSPLSSPTSSSSPLSESGIEDDSDMDDQVTTPAEYAMDDSTPAGVHTKTMCLPSVPCAITDSEAAAQARKLNEEHPSCLMEAQQELKKLLKQLISSPGAQPAKQPVVESTQTPLVVPAFNVSANRAGSPSTGITNAPVTVSSAEGQSMAQPQMGDDPVSALVSVLKPNMPQGEQPADVILQQNGNEHGARIEPKLVIIEEPEEVCSAVPNLLFMINGSLFLVYCLSTSRILERNDLQHKVFSVEWNILDIDYRICPILAQLHLQCL